MGVELPRIAKAARALLLAAEQAATAFPRRHRHGLGEELRGQAREVVRLCSRAWRDVGRRLHWTIELQWAIDEVKLSLQLGQELRAFRSFDEFDALIRNAEDLGKQAGAWRRSQQHPTGQNATPSTGTAARRDTGHALRHSNAGANS